MELANLCTDFCSSDRVTWENSLDLNIGRNVILLTERLPLEYPDCGAGES